jgi:hypothetical protein
MNHQTDRLRHVRYFDIANHSQLLKTSTAKNPLEEGATRNCRSTGSLNRHRLPRRRKFVSRSYRTSHDLHERLRPGPEQRALSAANSAVKHTAISSASRFTGCRRPTYSAPVVMPRCANAEIGNRSKCQDHLFQFAIPWCTARRSRAPQPADCNGNRRPVDLNSRSPSCEPKCRENLRRSGCCTYKFCRRKASVSIGPQWSTKFRFNQKTKARVNQ